MALCRARFPQVPPGSQRRVSPECQRRQQVPPASEARLPTSRCWSCGAHTEFLVLQYQNILVRVTLGQLIVFAVAGV